MQIRENLFRIVQSDLRFRIFLGFLTMLWYLALFPGRLGFDYSEAIRIMNRGESTDWWTASFWWYLKISTFGGSTLVFSSLISLVILGYSLYYLCESLSNKNNINRIALLILFINPIYGGFGVNISHDVFIASGIILFTAYRIRIYRGLMLRSGIDHATLFFAGVLVITTHYGLFIVLANALILLYERKFRLSFALPSISLLLVLISSIGVTQVPKFGPVLVIVGDLKCVVQHPQAEITDQEWRVLKSLAPESEWMTPTKCSFIDDALRALPSLNLVRVELDWILVETYLGITSRNTAIVALAHFQRASVALPPPFFSGPKNQVNLDPDIPIGLGTNTALQSNAEVLHPSIDEPSVAFKVPALKVLEIPAQGLVFIVNQASWFWGWGGLWLWPFIIYSLIYLKRQFKKSILPILSSTLLLHALLLILGAPLPRYVMATILIGNYLLLNMITDLYLKFVETYTRKSNG